MFSPRQQLWARSRHLGFRWGFHNAAHFSRVFRERFAAFPTEIRKQDASCVRCSKSRCYDRQMRARRSAASRNESIETARAKATCEARTLDLGELDDVLGWWLTAAYFTVQSDLRSRFEPLGLAPAQYAILILVERSPGCRQGDVGKALGVTHTNLAGRVEALVARDFIERYAHPSDKRINVLRLTQAGTRFLRRARSVHAEHLAEFTRRFTPADYKAFVGYLRELGRERRPLRFGPDE